MSENSYRICVISDHRDAQLCAALTDAAVHQGHQWSSATLHLSQDVLPVSDAIALSEAQLGRIDFPAFDAVLVLRPTQFPTSLLRRIKSRAAKLLGWFTLDEDELSEAIARFGLFDKILYTGASLQSNRPTANAPVFFPRWFADRLSAEQQQRFGASDGYVAVFNDMETRDGRALYHELAHAERDFRVVGSIADDFFHLSLGVYADSQDILQFASEAAAVAVCDVSELSDAAGEFTITRVPGESGLLQSAALGLPLISVGFSLLSMYGFPATYSVSDLSQISNALAPNTADAPTPDNATHFESYFSAESRVQFLHECVRSLSEDLPLTTTFASTVGSFRASNEHTLMHGIDAARLVSPVAVLAEPARVLLLGTETSRPTSRPASFARALEYAGHEVESIELSSAPTFLERDPMKVARYIINVAALAESTPLSKFDYLVVAGTDACLTDAGRGLLRENGIRTIAFDDSSSRWARHLVRLASSFDLVATSATRLVDVAQALRIPNVVFYPHFVNPDYVAALEAAQTTHSVVKCRRSIEREYELSPAVGVDASGRFEDSAHHFLHLKRDSLTKMAAKLKAEILLLSTEGHFETPEIDEIMSYAWVSSEVAFMPVSINDRWLEPFGSAAISVNGIGELKRKSDPNFGAERRLERAQQAHEQVKSFLLAGPQFANGLLLMSTDLAKTSPVNMLNKGHIVPLWSSNDLSLAHGQAFSGIAVSVQAACNGVPISDFQVRIVQDGDVLGRRDLRDRDSFYVEVAGGTATISVDLVYVGPTMNMSIESVLDMQITVTPAELSIEGSTKARLVG